MLNHLEQCCAKITLHEFVLDRTFLRPSNFVLNCNTTIVALPFSQDQRYFILISRIWRFELWDLADFACVL